MKKIEQPYSDRLIALSEELEAEMKKHKEIEINLACEIYYLIGFIQGLKI